MFPVVNYEISLQRDNNNIQLLKYPCSASLGFTVEIAVKKTTTTTKKKQKQNESASKDISATPTWNISHFHSISRRM